MMTAVAITMAIYDWRLASIAVLSAVPLFLILKVLQRRILAAWDLVRTKLGDILGAIGEADDAGRILMVSQNYRYRAQARAIRELVAQGAIGTLISIRIERARSGSSPVAP